MKKRFSALCVISLFLAGPFFAQESKEENSSQKEIVGQDKAIPPAKSRVDEIKENVQEYNEKKEAQEKERPVNALQFLGDFFTDKLPLTLDFGAEPGENGSMIFASLQYDWGKHFSSRVRFEHSDAKTIENNPLGYAKNETKLYSGTLYPCIWYFGDENIDSMEALWSFGFGFNYRYSRVKSQSFAALGYYFSNNESQSDFHIIAPVLTASVKKPLGKYFVLGTELTSYPVFFIHMNWKAFANPNYTAPVSYDYTYNIFSTPGIYQSLWFDILSYLRLKTLFSYSRMDLGFQRSVMSDGRILEGDFVQHELTWRYGFELVLPSSNRTRKKDSHLWAGVYYQHEWKLETFAGQYSTNYAGRWVLCFGK